MKLITRAASAVAFSTTLFASTAALALTPFDAATLAYRGQLDGIDGYQALELSIRNGSITGEGVLEAAGLEANASDANFIERILRDSNGRND